MRVLKQERKRRQKRRKLAPNDLTAALGMPQRSGSKRQAFPRFLSHTQTSFTTQFLARGYPGNLTLSKYPVLRGGWRIAFRSSSIPGANLSWGSGCARHFFVYFQALGACLADENSSTGKSPLPHRPARNGSAKLPMAYLVVFPNHRPVLLLTFQGSFVQYILFFIPYTREKTKSLSLIHI